MYVRGYLQGSENGRVVTIAHNTTSSKRMSNTDQTENPEEIPGSH